MISALLLRMAIFSNNHPLEIDALIKLQLIPHQPSKQTKSYQLVQINLFNLTEQVSLHKENALQVETKRDSLKIILLAKISLTFWHQGREKFMVHKNTLHLKNLNYKHLKLNK